MKNKTKGTIIKWVSIVLCVGAPLAATISQFPVWIATSDRATISGIAVILLFLSCLPFIRVIKEKLKSPAAWLVWTILAVLTILLANIIYQMRFVCIVGAISNGIGALLFKWAARLSEKPDKDKNSGGGGDGGTD
jgi:hypothetical protein